MRMIILNTRTQYKKWEAKVIECDNCSPHDLNKIYDFYSNLNGWYTLYEM